MSNEKQLSEKVEGVLRDALEEANGLLRSAYAVVVREGAETNWAGLQKLMEAALARQHILMFPDSHGPDGVCKSGCAALTEQQPRAAPPISLEEQAQPDAQDLTEEEIEAFDNFIWHEADQESCARWKHIYAEVKRRRGIK